MRDGNKSETQPGNLDPDDAAGWRATLKEAGLDHEEIENMIKAVHKARNDRAATNTENIDDETMKAVLDLVDKRMDQKVEKRQFSNQLKAMRAILDCITEDTDVIDLEVLIEAFKRRFALVAASAAEKPNASDFKKINDSMQTQLDSIETLRKRSINGGQSVVPYAELVPHVDNCKNILLEVENFYLPPQ